MKYYNYGKFSQQASMEVKVFHKLRGSEDYLKNEQFVFKNHFLNPY